MSIPLCSNVAITKITQSLVDSNSSVLNDIAGIINLENVIPPLGGGIGG